MPGTEQSSMWMGMFSLKRTTPSRNGTGMEQQLLTLIQVLMRVIPTSIISSHGLERKSSIRQNGTVCGLRLEILTLLPDTVRTSEAPSQAMAMPLLAGEQGLRKVDKWLHSEPVMVRQFSQQNKAWSGHTNIPYLPKTRITSVSFPILGGPMATTIQTAPSLP